MHSILTGGLLVAYLLAQPAQAATPGETTFKARCAACHDAQLEQAPNTQVLIGLPHKYIVAALNSGPMKPMAAGLSSDDIAAVATYLTAQKKAVAASDSLQAPEFDANMCTGKAPPFTLGAGDWNGFSPSSDNARFQKTTALNRSNVAGLKPRWVFAYPGGSVLGPPTSAGGLVFLGTRMGNVYALDARTGCTRWYTKPGASVKSPVVVGELAGSAKGKPRYAAYYGDGAGVVNAVDVETGKHLWKVKADDHPHAGISGAIVIADNKLYVPVMTANEGGAATNSQYGCCTLRGSLVTLDARTGRKLSQGYTIQTPAQPFKRNAAGVQMHGPSGASVWSPATIDTVRGVSYVTTGQSRTDVPEDGSDAVLALDMTTGARRWGRQFTANDAWQPGCAGSTPNANCPTVLGPDTDFGSPVVLQKLAGGGRVMVAAQKSGAVHGLDPEAEGKSLWRVELAKDAELPTGRILRDRENAGVVFGMASDGRQVYVAIADPNKTAGHVPSGVYALDLATGAIIWRAPGAALPSCSWGADGCAGAQRTAVAMAEGVVFAGAANGHMYAYDADSGKVLWDYDAARNFDAVNGVTARGGAIEGVATAVTSDTLYVAAGYASYGGGYGNALIAFSPEGALAREKTGPRARKAR